jgi:hypothetical protein
MLKGQKAIRGLMYKHFKGTKTFYKHRLGSSMQGENGK